MVRSLKPPIRSTLQNLCQDSPIQTKNFSWIFLDLVLIQRGNAFHFVAIDGVSKYPSALINRNSGNESFIKFLYGYIDQNCILSNLGTDQHSGFKNAKTAFFVNLENSSNCLPSERPSHSWNVVFRH